MRTRWRWGEPSSRRSDFSPLWPASPPPSRVRTSPKGRSISSWMTTTRSRSTLYAPRAGPAERPASFMKVCGRSTATRGPPGPVRPSVIRPLNFFDARGSSHRCVSALATSKPTLCGVAAYCEPGLPRPTMSQSTGALARNGLRKSGYSLEASASAGASPSAAPSPSAASPSGGSSPSPTSSVSVSISSSVSITARGTVIVATTVSGSSSSVTLAGAVISATVTVAAGSRCDASNSIVSGMSVGSASTLSSRTVCSSTPPSLIPGASSTPTMSSTTVAWMATERSTRSRSTCMVSPRTGWRWVSLRTAGVVSPSSATSSTAPVPWRAWRSSRASTSKGTGPPLPPYRTPGTRPSRRSRRMAREPDSWRGRAFRRVAWLAMRPTMVASRARPPDRAQLGRRRERLLHLGVRRFERAVELDQALLVDGRIGMRVAAVPVGANAELLQRPVHRAVEPGLGGEDTEVVVDEVVLEGVGALLLDRPVTVGLGAELGHEHGLARIALVHGLQVVAERRAVGDLAVGAGVPAEVVVDADDVERPILRLAARRRVAGDGEADGARRVELVGGLDGAADVVALDGAGPRAQLVAD